MMVIGATVFVALFTAPFEAMTWWSRRPLADDAEAAADNEANESTTATAPDRDDLPTKKAVIFYVTGIGTMSGESHPVMEAEFLDEMKKAIPQATVIKDFFPYAPSGIPLNGQRIFARFWRFLGGHNDGVAKNLIRLRNMFQVIVAADGRYGPIYSAGTFQVMRRKLRQEGLFPAPNIPIILLGYSGGAEVSVGAAPFLRSVHAGRLSLFSLGGVLTSHAGLDALDMIVHIEGTKDRVVKFGGIVAFQRWRVFFRSYWNEARRQGRIMRVTLTGIGHNGPNGYLDGSAKDAGTGLSNRERTLDALIKMVEDEIRETARDQDFLRSSL
jgi:hypothetical protein